MESHPPFEKVLFQWLTLLVKDPQISTQACRIATYLAVVRYNSDEGKAWPSHLRVAEDLSICSKTVQRAIKDLEGKWFEIDLGKGPGHSTIYVPTESSHAAAVDLKRNNGEAKRDKVVPFPDKNGGQSRPKRRTILSQTPCQNCPPIESKELIQEASFDDVLASVLAAYEDKTWVRIPEGSPFATAWDATLSKYDAPRLQRLFPESRRGFRVPSRWPCLDCCGNKAAKVAGVLTIAVWSKLADRLRHAS
ncbi:MAG: hypothetical protein GVY36_19865 [Verrucomicrobia bacterium]|jgi:hypothetical protein|nr:hypothetical protein [Verrucomicrobiota bacterium]